MTLRLTRWRGTPRRAVMLALVAALIPLPAAASETTPAPKAKTSQVSLKERAAQEASRMALTRDTRVRRAEQDSAAKDSPAFFKTKPGAIALAVMVVGVGYALYSAKNDRITSPAKK